MLEETKKNLIIGKKPHSPKKNPTSKEDDKFNA